MSINLKDLGLNQEQLQEMVVNRISEQVLNSTGLYYSEDEDREIEVPEESSFAKKLNKEVRTRIDEAIQRLAEKHIFPQVAAYVENLTLQETNKWGEATGQKITFVEYLTQRAEGYLREKVDYDGKSKKERDGYSWSGTQTRITHLVNKHLHYTIEQAMKDAVRNANTVIAEGLVETTKIKLEEIARTLRVSIKTK